MGITTFVPETPVDQIATFQSASFLFCFFIAIAIFMLLPKKMPIHKKLFATAFIFIGMWGLFLIMVMTLSNLLA
ncbi:MAG: hypothetical protein V1740_07185 [Candidatus Woesearchaeota archaeon]